MRHVFRWGLKSPSETRFVSMTAYEQRVTKKNKRLHSFWYDILGKDIMRVARASWETSGLIHHQEKWNYLFLSCNIFFYDCSVQFSHLQVLFPSFSIILSHNLKNLVYRLLRRYINTYNIMYINLEYDVTHTSCIIKPHTNKMVIVNIQNKTIIGRISVSLSCKYKQIFESLHW